MKYRIQTLISIFIIILSMILINNQLNINATASTNSLKIIRIHPSKNSFRVSVNTTIYITFDGPIQNISNNSLIVEDNNGLFISGNISYNNSFFKIIFTPDNPLEFNTNYWVTFNIGQKYTWSFKTESKILIIHLLSPNNQSVLRTTSPTLSWVTNYLNSTDEIIYYDVYMSINKTKVTSYDHSVCIAKNCTNTSINIFALNGFITYWTIVPHVGNISGYCVSGIWSFKPDISPPFIKLLFPKYNTTINTTSTILSWEKDWAFSFDIYFSTNETLVNEHNESVVISKNQTTTFYEISNLSKGKSYYWTVVPYDGKYGFCRNGTWNFSIISDSDTNNISDSEDTDNDSYLDDWEEFLNTDPDDPNDKPLDYDNDGKPDGDPKNSQPWMDKDDDNDTMPDSWEIQYGLNPLNPRDAEQDKDDDEFTNKEEYDAGTDPTNPDDRPKLNEDKAPGGRDYSIYLILGTIIIVVLIISAIIMKSKKKN